MSTDLSSYGRQFIDQDDIDAVTAALSSGYLTKGPAVRTFEERLCEVTGADHAVACANGTAALHLCMLALGLGPGDVAIVPAITFAATANAARYVGADVVFSDVDPITGLMTPTHLEAAIASAQQHFPNGRIRTVHNVHLNGQTEDLPKLAKIAKVHNLTLLNDACHAIGGDYLADDGSMRPIGSAQYGFCEAFSFHPVKTIAMGEGGAITTNDASFAAELSQRREHGITRDTKRLESLEPPAPWYYEMQSLGFNYRVSDLNCALGAAQLAKLPRFVAARRQISDHYRYRLAGLHPNLQPLGLTGKGNPAWHLMPVLIDFAACETSRAQVMQKLAAQKIGTQVHYMPVYAAPYYRRYWQETVGHPQLHLPGVENYYQAVLSLPLFFGMNPADADRVVDSLADCLNIKT